MGSHPMSNIDAAWLRMDRPENLMAITSVLSFDGPVDDGRLRELLLTRLVERFPRFRQRVVEGGVLGGPHWEDDTAFDLDLHLHRVALPAPHGQAELEAFAGDLMATPLDHGRPLWHVHVVERVGAGGTAIVVRIHHCIADGIALARVLLSLTDPAPGRPRARLAPPAHEHALPGAAGALAGAAAAAGGALDALAHEGAETVRHPRHAGELLAGAGGVVRALAKELASLPDPTGPLHRPPGRGERVAWCAPRPLSQVKAIANAHDATVNDVLVAAVAGGLRRWQLAHGGDDRELRAMVPFNLRPLDEPLPRELGNRFGLVLLSLPLGEPDPLARLYETRRRMRAIKDSPEGAVSLAVIGALGLAPPAVETRLIDLFSAKASLVLTNVPGPREPVTLAGERVRGVLVWAPCAGSVAMSVSVVSYAGEVTVGVMADAGLVPAPGGVVAAIEQELAALQPQTGASPSAQPSAYSPAKTSP